MTIPLINQGGGAYNTPPSTASTYTPVEVAKSEGNRLLMVIAAAVGISLLLPKGRGRRSLW